MNSKFSLAMLAAATLFLGGCFADELDGGSNNKLPNGSPDSPAAVNHAPTIGGTPTYAIVEGEYYEFLPSAADQDGDALEFSISRKPAWATFDRASGRLSGTPDADDVGNFTNIVITVSDGSASAALGEFDITVDAIALGSATLSWNPPTQNSDGTALTDLVGYRIYYGRNADQLTRTVVVDNPGLTRYMIDNLSPARWHFSMTSINATGRESARTPTVSKLIS